MTIPKEVVQVYLNELEKVKQNNYSFHHGLMDARDKVGEGGVLRDDTYERSFELLLLLVREVMQQRATENLQNQVRKDLNTIFEEKEYSAKTRSELMNSANVLSYSNCITPRDVTQVNFRGMMEDIEGEIQGDPEEDEKFTTLAVVVSENISQINFESIQKLIELFQGIDAIVSEKNGSADWESIYIHMLQWIGEMDSDVRYIGDV